MKVHLLESERLLWWMKYLVKNARVRNVDNQAVAVPTADVSAKILARTVDCHHVLAAIAGKAGIITTRS